MFDFLNRRLSLSQCVALIAACAALPVALLLYLFVSQTLREERLIDLELEGADYIARVWPSVVTGQPLPPLPRLTIEGAVPIIQARERAARNAPAAGRGAAAANLIQIVADHSNLTLDADLGTYYAMETATVALPQVVNIANGLQRASDSEARAVALGRLRAVADQTQHDIRESIQHNNAGEGPALGQVQRRLAAAIARLDAAPSDVQAQGGMVAEADLAWKALDLDLVRQLHARQQNLRARVAGNLELIAAAFAFAAFLAIGFLRESRRRLRRLIKTMDGLNAGDARIDIPYLSDLHETGQIAVTLAAYKQRLAEGEQERKRTEAANRAVRESEARYRMLADNSNDLIIQYDLDFTAVYVSPSARRFSFEPEHLLGKRNVQFVHPDDRAIIDYRRGEALAGRHVPVFEGRLQVPDGRELWVESTLVAARGPGGQISGFIATLRDISDRRAAEAALQEISDELARVARASALGAFAASIAHEVNQPLAAALIDGETALRWLNAPDAPPGRATRSIERATANVRRASEVVARLRSMVIKERSVHADFDLADAVREVLSLTERESQRAGATVSAELAGAWVTGDRIQIQQVALNLLSNAIDAAREAPPERRRITVRTEARGEVALLSVEDQGEGISTDQAPRIFEHLFTTKVGGTGLGLPISRTIVEAHEGRLWLEAVEPHGAAFKVALPARGPADRAADLEHSAEASTAG